MNNKTLDLINVPMGKEHRTHVEHVVVGENGPGMKRGDIRWLRWSRDAVPPQLEVSFDTRDGKRVRATRVTVSAEYQARGWKTLRQLFQDDPEKRQHWDDWLAFCDEQQRNRLGMSGRKFPDRLLPQALIAMREEGDEAAEQAANFTFSDGSGLGSEPKPRKKPGPKPKTDDVEGSQ